MTAFVLHSAAVAGERTVEKRATLILSARESEVFVDLATSSGVSDDKLIFFSSDRTRILFRISTM